jgi:hypothetical protein
MLRKQEVPLASSVVGPAAPTSITGATIRPENLITIEEMARRLRPDISPEKGIAWVREKTRRRSPNPIPFHNLGRHVMFEWTAVSEWIRNLPRLVHAAHRRTRKLKVAA